MAREWPTVAICDPDDPCLAESRGGAPVHYIMDCKLSNGYWSDERRIIASSDRAAILSHGCFRTPRCPASATSAARAATALRSRWRSRSPRG
jgi:hypothetical protein